VKINKAVITVAGRDQRNLPLQTLVDRDGQTKSALMILLEEVLQAGIEEIGLVVAPGDRSAFTTAVGPHVNRLHFIEQSAPLGYGHAVLCAHAYTKSEPFMLLVGDHLYVAKGEKPCAKQLVEIAEAESCAVSAGNRMKASCPTTARERRCKDARHVPCGPGDREADTTVAEQKLIVPSARRPLPCFFGMHVLTASVMNILEELVRDAKGAAGVHLTHARQDRGAGTVSRVRVAGPPLRHRS
jgi:UTP--glucose-1-phosphate uridylyltransferase